MRNFLPITICMLAFSSLASAAIEDTPIDSCNHRLFYTQPAHIWEEMLPVGNGRLGIMTGGNIYHECLTLNEISLWGGSPFDYSNPEASKTLSEIQQLLFEGKNVEAQTLMYKSFVPKKDENGGTYGSYQVLGTLVLKFPGQPSEQKPNEIDGVTGATPKQKASAVQPTHYERSLSLRDGIARTQYDLGKTTYEREVYASRDKDVIIVHLRASKKGALNFLAKLVRPERFTISTEGENLVMKGTLDSGQPGIDGMKYKVAMRLLADKGAYNVSETEGITLAKGHEAWLVISATTNYEAKGTTFPGNRYETVCDSLLNAISYNNIKTIRDGHIAAHRNLYDRVSITLPATSNDVLPTDERIERLMTTDSPAMAVLYYNYGRYLLISSTRPGSLPPNLQGLWARTIQTPWNGDYHTNINVQMNHWPLEQAGLGELCGPLTTLMERSISNGEKTAKVFYGPKAQGWVMHMMTNVWGYTDPGEHPSWGATNTGGAWMTAHFMDHYRYTGDIDYLRRVYPMMKGSAQFFHSTTVKEPKNGWIVTAPTSSPENSFYVPGDTTRTPVAICMGPTMDIQILTELYRNVIEASRILHVDADFAAQLEADIKQFPPMQISKQGYLQEWLQDYEEAEITHRHVSHLYGLYPSNLISPETTPELSAAARVTLNRRGDEATGWSRAWKINFWARLGDGNRAYKLFKSLLSPSYHVGEYNFKNNSRRGNSGTYPNLFCAHPPFQIDGNYGGAAGIGEMLLQSHMGFVKLLPALPDSWNEGSFKGLHVRGGATVDLYWKYGKPTEATFSALHDTTIKLLVPEGMTCHYGSETVTAKDKHTFTTLTMKAGQVISIKFQ